MEMSGLNTLDHLDAEQRARVAALYEARVVTTLKVPAPQVQAAESFDLIELARFIEGAPEPQSGDK